MVTPVCGVFCVVVTIAKVPYPCGISGKMACSNQFDQMKAGQESDKNS